MKIHKFFHEFKMIENKIDKLLYLFTKVLQILSHSTKKRYNGSQLTNMVFNFFRRGNEVCIRFKNFRLMWPVIDLGMPPMYAYGSHEPILHKFFRPSEGEVVIDIGAYTGYYTILSALAVGNKGWVLSIEANPYTAKILRKNLMLNNIKNVIVLNKALWDTTTKLNLYLAEDLISGRDSVVRQNRRFIEVEATTLDYVIDGLDINHVDWIKIDVEGAEYNVLSGAIHTLKSNKSLRVFIEAHTSLIAKDVQHFMSSISYIPVQKDSRHIFFIHK